MNKSFVLSAAFVVLISSSGMTIAPQSASAPMRQGTANPNQNVFFRTKSYGVQIIWRAGVPFMTVSNNGFRVLVDARAEVMPARGSADSWTTYTARSGDYAANVRVSPSGQGAIEVTLGGNRLTQEYAISAPRQQPQPKTTLKDGTLLAFETAQYAVRVFRREDKLLMNLYNKQTAKTDLQQVPITAVNTSEGMVYRYDGQSTIQAREDIRGGRSLLIIRDNAIQYRGEAF